MSYKVYLDPGHGGIDPGAEGCGKKESECALSVARKVMALLPGRYFEARMSRNSQNIPDNNHPNSDLNRRAREANNWGASIFVSIHLNSGGGTGAETYCAVCGGQSRVLAGDIQSQVQAATGMKAHGGPVKTDNIRGAAGDYLCVIRETAMPAVLHECCFIDSAADMARFNPDRWALGIANGICKYFGVPLLSSRGASATYPEKICDTTKDMDMSRLSVYQVRTFHGAQLSSGNSQIALVIPRTSDLWFVVAVGNSGQSAGIYTTLPGKKAVKTFTVKIK